MCLDRREEGREKKNKIKGAMGEGGLTQHPAAGTGTVSERR